MAGFDLTFSPAKSVSALWAVAPPEVASGSSTAHNAAVSSELAFLESHAVFTREGAGGARQVETRGLIAAAFTHRDSRAGDPDLHTHVAVANKVQTREGKWLSIYGTILHEHVVAASEAYNTALEAHLHAELGVRFVDVPGRGGSGRCGRSPASTRRYGAVVEPSGRHRGPRRGTRRGVHRASHGRPPNDKESIALAQRANLETRRGEARAALRGRAAHDLARPKPRICSASAGLRIMIDAAPRPRPTPAHAGRPAWLTSAERVISELEAHRATWQSWHMYAEAQRQVRDLDLAPEQVAQVVEHSSTPSPTGWST